MAPHEQSDELVEEGRTRQDPEWREVSQPHGDRETYIEGEEEKRTAHRGLPTSGMRCVDRNSDQQGPDPQMR